MKTLLTLALLISATQLYGQTLNLKKKQHFKYEMLRWTKYEPNVPSSNSTYKVLDFEVLKASKGQYVLRVLESSKLTVANGKLYDTKLPLQEQAKNFEAISAKVLSTIPYFLTIDKNSNILLIDGLEEIKTKTQLALEEYKVPEGRQTNKSLLDLTFDQKGFTSRMKNFFRGSDTLGLDSAYVGKGEVKTGRSEHGGPTIWVSHPTLDSNVTSRNVGVEKKTGLLVNFSENDLSLTLMLDTKQSSYHSSKDAVNLVSSNIDGLGFENLLFKEFDKMFGYNEYYSPQQVAVRKLDELNDYLSNQKGKLGIAEEVEKKVDSLDRLFSDNDQAYWAKRLDLAGIIGDRSYGDLYERVPYEAMTREYHLMNKLEREYKAGNSANLNYALELIFKKFSRVSNGGYPLNMHHLESLIHNDMAKDIFHTNNKQDLLKRLKVIEQVELLKDPRIDRMFLALKTYVKAKLASTPEEMTDVINTSFAGLSNRKGKYRLLIYDELTNNMVADSVRRAYLDYSIEQFKNTLVGLQVGDDRVLTRKYLADAYYRKSLLEKKGATSYLSLAGDYMPDQQDRQDDNYILEPEQVFLPAKDYNKMLVGDSGIGQLSVDQKLSKMVDLLIIEPERFLQVKKDYNVAFPKGDFKAFINKALKSKLPRTPLFILKETNDKETSSVGLKEPFTFIDFWGTWCVACVSEIHLVEALHLENPSPEKLKVTTIACFDKKTLVDDFMAKKKYSYQVLMSDGKVEKDFKVFNYPTKILLLPNGVYVDIPSRSEYASLIQKYLAWEL